MKTVYFIRHAETQAIADGVLAGSEFETTLTDKGRQQAREAGVWLQDKNIELIMVSPMTRTKQTAKIIAKELGLDNTKIIESKLITERAYGNYSGRSFKEYTTDLNSGQLDESQLEPSKDLHSRVRQALDWLIARPEQTILVVSHGATGRMFRAIQEKRHHRDFREVKRFATAEIDKFTL